MKHKEKECTWAPGMQDTDVTFAGDHTWATILRAQKEQSGRTGSHGGRYVVIGLGIAALAVGAWLII